MATREENIKKINDELEKLDDEQLEQVAGGTMRELIEGKQLGQFADGVRGTFLKAVEPKPEIKLQNSPEGVNRIDLL